MGFTTLGLSDLLPVGCEKNSTQVVKEIFNEVIFSPMYVSAKLPTFFLGFLRWAESYRVRIYS